MSDIDPAGQPQNGNGEAASGPGIRVLAQFVRDFSFENPRAPESLRGGLSLSACGFGYWSHDIGGFEGLPPAAVYKRWVAFGLMSSHSRLHGSSSYRVPWNYDDDACDVLRFFTKLKCRLMPYLYAAAVEAHREGIPMMRPMQIEFPDDPACDTLDRQYMLGGSLLVAPVFSEDGWVDYYLPEGRWTHLLTGEVQEGGRWRRAQYGFLSLGLFVRANTALAVGANETRPDYDYADDVTLHVYELADGAEASCRVTDVKGNDRAAFAIRRRGNRYEAQIVSGQVDRWALTIGGAFGAASPSSAAVKRVVATGSSAVVAV